MASDEIDRIIKETFLNEFCDGYISVGKYNTCLPRYYTEYAHSIQNFEVRDDDVFVATYPRSGTTWTQEMVWMILNDLDLKRAEKDLFERFPFLEICILHEFKTRGFPKCIQNSVEFTKQQESPRFIKTHLPFHLLPEQIQNGTKKPKIIYVTRNPKDVCVSNFHHHKLVAGIKANLEEFAKVFLAGKEVYGPYWNHILGYWEHRGWSNILIIKYEDMKTALKAVIGTVARFLEKELTEDLTERLLKHLSFESMKNNKSFPFDRIIDKYRQEGFISDEGSFFRSGTVGQYKEELSPETVDKLNAWIKSNISGTSYEQEYDFKL